MSQFIRRTTTLAGTDFAQALNSETRAPVEGDEGFGCPNEYKCHNHCKSIQGYKGGYCKSWFRRLCKCY